MKHSKSQLMIENFQELQWSGYKSAAEWREFVRSCSVATSINPSHGVDLLQLIMKLLDFRR